MKQLKLVVMRVAVFMKKKALCLGFIFTSVYLFF